MFGHPIELNFNQSGSRHNTAIGGFFSLLIKGIILYFSVIIMSRLFTFGDNNEIQNSYLLDMDDESPDAVLNIEYASMRSKIFLAIS